MKPVIKQKSLEKAATITKSPSPFVQVSMKMEGLTLKKTNTLAPNNLRKISNSRMDKYDYMAEEDFNNMKQNVAKEFHDDIALKKDVWAQILK